eukprot:TRINITY_DN18221_c0_g1_i1.p1 TRINITY_DN18221_c0_g1~~TRINITY_DN18221_c0_g1_i1.p1  ORF type:complete len:600 (-),score=145.63 TRINITY_DN18221_c0_g1_i1:42-1841(-)
MSTIKYETTDVVASTTSGYPPSTPPVSSASNHYNDETDHYATIDGSSKKKKKKPKAIKAELENERITIEQIRLDLQAKRESLRQLQESIWKSEEVLTEKETIYRIHEQEYILSKKSGSYSIGKRKKSSPSLTSFKPKVRGKNQSTIEDAYTTADISTIPRHNRSVDFGDITEDIKNGTFHAQLIRTNSRDDSSSYTGDGASLVRPLARPQVPEASSKPRLKPKNRQPQSFSTEILNPDFSLEEPINKSPSSHHFDKAATTGALNLGGAANKRRWFVKYQSPGSELDLIHDFEMPESSTTGSISAGNSPIIDETSKTRKWTNRKGINNMDELEKSYGSNINSAATSNKRDKRDVTGMDQRARVINELIETESDYVRDMKIVIELYMEPLRKSKVVSVYQLNMIFCNIEKIMEANKKLLSLLEQQPPVASTEGNDSNNNNNNSSSSSMINGKRIGQAFLETDFWKLYSLYCSNQPQSLAIIAEECKKNRDFDTFLTYTQAKPESRSLDLNSFLIKPVQRVCKYPLLLKELLKQTPKEHEDYESLMQAYDKMEQTVASINEQKKKVDKAVQSLYNEDVILSSGGVAPHINVQQLLNLGNQEV